MDRLVTGAFIDRNAQPLVLGVFLDGEPDEDCEASAAHEVPRLQLASGARRLLEELFFQRLISAAAWARHEPGVGMIRLVPNGQGNNGDLGLYIAEIIEAARREADNPITVDDDMPDDKLKKALIDAFETLLRD